MEHFLAAFLFFGLSITAMAVGVLAKGKCLKGTCGGLNQMKDENGKPICEACAPDKVRKLSNE